MEIIERNIDAMVAGIVRIGAIGGCLFLLNCTSLKNNTPSVNKPTRSLIIGKWKYEQSFYKVRGNGMGPGSSVNLLDTGKYIEFYKNGKVKIDYGFEDRLIDANFKKYRIDQNGFLKFTSTNREDEFIFNVNNNTLQMSSRACDEGCMVAFVRIR